MRRCVPVVRMICLKMDGWALRLTVLVQLAIWSAVGIVLLHKGICSLQERTLESADCFTEEISSSMGGMTAEYTAVSSMEHADGKDGFAIKAVPKQSIDKSEKIITQMNTELSLRNDRDHELSLTKNTLKNTPDIVQKELSSALSSSHSFEVSASDHSLGIKEDADNSDNETADGAIPTNIYAEEKNIELLKESILQLISKKEKNVEKDEGLDFMGNALSRSTKTSEETSMRTLSTWKEINQTDNTMTEPVLSRRNKHRTEFSRRVSSSGTTTAIVMIVIGSIMLSLVPVMIILRLLYDRKQTRKLIAELSSVSREGTPPPPLLPPSPPSYEEAVLMCEAPRYSTLDLDERADNGRSSQSLSLPFSPSSPAPNETLLRRTF